MSVRSGEKRYNALRTEATWGAIMQRLAWGRDGVELDFAEGQLVPLERAADAAPLADPAAAVAEALEAPLEFPALRRALTPDDHVAVFVDQSLPGLAGLLTPIMDHLGKAGIGPEAVTLLCLPGGDESWIDHLPDEYSEVQIEIHQPAERKKLAYLATTKKGRRVYLNRTAVDADQLVLLARRRYDCRLGYTGGETSLFPTLSDEAVLGEFFKQHHFRMPRADHPWEGSKEASEIAWLLGTPFFVQIIEGVGPTVTQVVAGTIDSIPAGKRALDRHWRLSSSESADLVITSLVGSDHSFEDVARAFWIGSQVVKPRGRVVVLSDARPELGPSAGLMRNYESPAEAGSLLLKEMPHDVEGGVLWSQAAQTARLYLLSRLPSDAVEEMFATPLEKAGQVQRLIAQSPRCVMFADGHKTLAEIR